jgi:hypothetical protein
MTTTVMLNNNGHAELVSASQTCMTTTVMLNNNGHAELVSASQTGLQKMLHQNTVTKHKNVVGSLCKLLVP